MNEGMNMMTSSGFKVSRIQGFRRSNARTLQLSTVLLALAVFAAPAAGQRGSRDPLPGPRGVYAIRSARIVTVSGPVIERGTIGIGADGKISVVGADAAVPSNATS